MDYRDDNDEQLTTGISEYEELEKQRKSTFRKGIATGISITMVVVLLLVTAASVVIRKNGLMLTSYKMDSEAAEDVISSGAQTKLAEVISALSKYYYKDLDSDKMVEGLYAGVVDSLGDKYTAYFTKEEYQDYVQGTQGTYQGIGILLTQDKNTGVISISRVYKGTPAEEAGLKAGDEFVSADGYKAENTDITEFATHVKGDAGSKVKIVIKRDGKEKTYNIKRKTVEMPTVNYQMLKDNVGYIQITEFDQVTTEQFNKAISDLKSQNMKSLIVDLRDNPGGMVTTVTDILDQLLPKGVLVYTKDKEGNKKEYKSDSRELGLPMAVLVNENSASAAEIFAGAVKDYGYGTLIGTKTYGKGIVQVLLPLSDGSAIKVTTARYFTPKGNYIHEKGIEPDIELEYKYENKKDKTYNIMHDNQVKKALKVLKEK
ncbi:MAG: S41 family peptidase [Lachnospiraceae bacterium]|nr:S41 family peptidase [Lachnospiraceae bacterium]